MSIWTLHPDKVALPAVYASYFISYICLGTAPLIMSWLSDLYVALTTTPLPPQHPHPTNTTERNSLPQDPEARTLIVGVTIAGYYAIAAWSQVLVWPAVQAPFCKLSRTLFPSPTKI